MNYFLKANKNLLTYSLIILLVIPIFGINFFISFLGNILLLLFLIPLLLVILVFLGFNYYKSKTNTCDSCGAINEKVEKESYRHLENLQSSYDRISHSPSLPMRY